MSATTLVTGGAGFIGSHLCDELLRQGDSVIAIDDLSAGRRQNLEDARRHQRFRFVQGSVHDIELITPLIDEVDRVAHLASSVGVGRIMQAPLESFENNLLGALSVSRIAAERHKPLVATSSSEVYGRALDGAPLVESSDRHLGPTSSPRWSYSTSKAAEEILVLGHAEAHGTRAAVARLFNTSGARQLPDHGMVLPRFVAAALTGEDLIVYGDGNQTRCFLHVHDAVLALISLLDSEESAGGTFNVGSIEPIRIRDLAAFIVEYCDSASRIRHVATSDVFDQPFEEPRHRIPSIDLILRTTEWTPTRSLDDIVRDLSSAQQTPDSPTAAAHNTEQSLKRV